MASAARKVHGKGMFQSPYFLVACMCSNFKSRLSFLYYLSTNLDIFLVIDTDLMQAHTQTRDSLLQTQLKEEHNSNANMLQVVNVYWYLCRPDHFIVWI